MKKRMYLKYYLLIRHRGLTETDGELNGLVKVVLQRRGISGWYICIAGIYSHRIYK